MIKKVPSHICHVHVTWSFIARVLPLSCLFIITAFNVQAQAKLIKDIDRREEVINNEFYGLFPGTTLTYFIGSYNELWRTGGTPEITIKLFENVSSVTVVGNTAYFTADGGNGAGAELWKSNGTPQGTVMVKDINPGYGGSGPQNITNVNGVIYFTANNGTNGIELWKTNGSASGTMMVKDILKAQGSSSPSALTNLNGTLYFSASNGSHGFELWKSNGTAESTVMVKDIRPGDKLSSAPQLITQSNGMLFFTAVDATGRELWKSDGTEIGTVRVKDIRAGGNSGIENLIDVNGTLFFTANDGIHGDELWKSDGTEAGTVLVKDMNPGSAGSNNSNFFTGTYMNNFRNINGKLFFIASQGYQDYIYRSDGTAAGTIRIMPAQETGMNYEDPNFTYMQGYVYFFNAEGDDRGAMYLWKMPVNGTTPVKVRRFFTPIDYLDEYYYENYTHAMVHCNNALYIVGRLRNDQGFKLIRSDGTSAGTQVIADTYISTLSSNPSEMVSVNNIVYFRTKPDPHNYLYGNDWEYVSQDLYRTDGTADGTYRLPGYFNDENEMEKAGNKLFYSASDTDGYWHLRVSDGTTVSEVTKGATGEGRPVKLTGVGNVLYYTNYMGELWKSDGTVAGTVMIKDLFKVNSITDVAGKAFVLAETSSGGLELWRTNATGALIRVKTIRTTPERPSEYNPTATRGNVFYFVANDGVHQNEIWQSDGTATGTFTLLDLNTLDPTSAYDGNLEADIRSMAYTNSHLMISGMDQTGNWVLFDYHVTAKTLRSFNLGEMPRDLIAHNGKVFFMADTQFYVMDGNDDEPIALLQMEQYADHVDYATIGNYLYIAISPYSTYIWRTDGTQYNITPIYMDADSSFPIEPSGDHMILGAASNRMGKEPHIYHNITGPIDYFPFAVETVAGGGAEDVMTPYPNPFTSNFTMQVKGNDDETAEVGVFDNTGLPIEKFENVKSNTAYENIGANWPRGVYIVKVSKNGKVSSHTVVKK